MRKLLAALALVTVAGCGQSIHSMRVENGVLREQTLGEVGFASASVKSESNDSQLVVCSAGLVPLNNPGLSEAIDGENIAICRKEMRDDAARKKRQRDLVTEPWGYSPYGYNPNMNGR